MNLSNNLPFDALSASQFNVPAMVRYLLPQNKNRSDGDFIPNLGGTFLRVESVDMPARISFNNTDYNQSIPLLSGLIIDGIFSGVTIWHDDYSGFGTSKPQIIFNIGRNKSAYVDSYAAGHGIQLPFFLSAINVNGFTLSIPVPLGFKKLSLNMVATVGNLSQPVSAIVSTRFYDAKNIAVSPGSLTRNNITYNMNDDSSFAVVDAKVINTNIYAYASSMSANIPSTAERCDLIVAIGLAVTGISRNSVAAYAS